MLMKQNRNLLWNSSKSRHDKQSTDELTVCIKCRSLLSQYPQPSQHCNLCRPVQHDVTSSFAVSVRLIEQRWRQRARSHKPRFRAIYRYQMKTKLNKRHSSTRSLNSGVSGKGVDKIWLLRNYLKIMHTADHCRSSFYLFDNEPDFDI